MEKLTKKSVDLRGVKFDPRRHQPQNIQEELTDMFFITLALREGELLNENVTTINLMKTLFQAKCDLAEKSRDFFYADFHVYKHGPFTKKMYDYLNNMQRAGLVEKEGNNISLTFTALSMMTELVNEVDKSEKDITELYKSYQKNLKKFNTANSAIKHTHSLTVLDTTDDNNIKTIDAISKSANAKLSEYYIYLEPMNELTSGFKLPNRVLNAMADIMAGISREDYEIPPKESDIISLYGLARI